MVQYLLFQFLVYFDYLTFQFDHLPKPAVSFDLVQYSKGFLTWHNFFLYIRKIYSLSYSPKKIIN